MVVICPKCDQILDFAEPIGNFGTRLLMCEPCAEAFAKEIKRKTIQDARELAARLMRKQ